MRIETRNVESGKKYSAEAPELDKDAINEFFNVFSLSEEEMKGWINQLDIPADAKAILH